VKFKPGQEVMLRCKNYNGRSYERAPVKVTVKQYNENNKMYWVILPNGEIKKMVKESLLEEEK